MMKGKKFLFACFLFLLLLCIGGLLVDKVVKTKGEALIIPPDQHYKTKQVAIVLGAYVYPNGMLCSMLQDRVETAVQLYKAGQVEKIMMTGDHGASTYDEVNAMRLYALQLGIPEEDIFTDHAGFSTYDSMYRAKDVFLVDSAIVVTQEFHLPRALYIADSLGIQAGGIKADKHAYAGIRMNELREIPARIKSFIQVVLQAKPRFLGDTIPITGDGKASWDQL